MGQKHKRFREFRTPFNSPVRHLHKSSKHVRACAAGDGEIFLKIEKKIAPYIMGKVLEMALAYRLLPRLWLLLEVNLSFTLCFTLYLRAIFQVQAPGGGGAYIWRAI